MLEEAVSSVFFLSIGGFVLLGLAWIVDKILP